MGFDDLIGDAVEKAKDFVEENPDKVDQGLDKAGELAKGQFGHGSEIDKAVDFLQDKL